MQGRLAGIRVPVLWWQSKVGHAKYDAVIGYSFRTDCPVIPHRLLQQYLVRFLLPHEPRLPCRLTDESGLIHDGIGNYSLSLKCSWLIDARGYYSEQQRVGGGHHHHHHHHQEQPTIRIHLEEFATECGWDHLYVYDGDSVESPLLAVFR